MDVDELRGPIDIYLSKAQKKVDAEKEKQEKWEKWEKDQEFRINKVRRFLRREQRLEREIEWWGQLRKTDTSLNVKLSTNIEKRHHIGWALAPATSNFVRASVML